MVLICHCGCNELKNQRRINENETPQSKTCYSIRSNNIILKHLLRGRIRPQSKVSDKYDAENEAIDENEDNSGESKDDERKSLKAYKKFMIGVMKLLVNHTDPDIKVESFNDNFEKAASITIQISESISKVSGRVA